MSVPNRSLSSQDLLRHRFAIWSLAIFGSFTSSGVVHINHPNLWAADDPAVGSTEGKAAALAEKEKSTNDLLTPGQLVAMLQAQKFTEAARLVDAAVATDPSPANDYLAYILASNLSQREPAVAAERFQFIINRVGRRAGARSPLQDITTLLNSSRALSTLLDSSGKSEEALQTNMNASAVAAKFGPRAAGLGATLLTQRCQLLIKLGREDEARSMLEQKIDEQLAKAHSETSLPSVSPELLTYGSLFREKQPQQVKEVFDKFESLLLAQIESENATLKDYMAYQALQMNIAQQLGQNSAQSADEVLVRLEQRATKFSEQVEENEKMQFDRALQSLRAARASFAARLLHESLIGEPAPELEIESVVNMDKVNWSDLKGKVVLIDFWAVWRGPCIATFPHLQHLRKEYGDRGLLIIGVTRQYGYTWDTEGKRALSKKDATLEEEVAMLDEFRKSHELEHGFIVTPPASDFSKKLGVTGIPQAVLVDQNGIIQLIRIGSGEKNAHAIESKVRELLGVPAEAAGKTAS